jgi:threonine dehydratase
LTSPVTLADILAARRTIAGVAVRTPLLPSPHLAPIAGGEVLLKLESLQPTGAFKLRGAVNAVAALPPDSAGVVCCSTGNHGRALAFAARARGLRAVVCMSALVPQTKVEAIRALGAEVRIVGRSQDYALAESRRLAAQQALVEVPPFDDARVIAGQGTAGLEIIEDRPDIATVLVPVSGGGLAAGVALAVKAANPAARVVGVSMDRGAAMHAAIRAGRPVEVEEVASLADSLGGGLGENRLTFALCRDLLDDIVLVTEAEIYRAMQALYFEDHIVAEGAAAVGIAVLLAGRLPALAGPVAAIVTGRNVDMAAFTRIVTGQDVSLGDLTLPGAAYAA